MTDHLGNSWREVYATLDCSTIAHDEQQPARDTDGDVTGVTIQAVEIEQPNRVSPKVVE